MKHIVILAVAATMFAACTKDDYAIRTTPDSLPQRIEAVIENSRTALNADKKLVWSAGDAVSVFYKNTGNVCYRFTGKSGDVAGTLLWESGKRSDEQTEKVVGVYPYCAATTITRDGTVGYVIPDRQGYAPDSFGKGSSLMIGRSENSPQLHFKNMMGWVKITLTGSATITEITFKGNSNEPLTGLATIKSSDEIVFNGERGESIVLDCGEGVALSDKPTAFIIAVVPQTFAKGYTVTVVDNEGKYMTLRTDKEITISRNSVKQMEAVEYKSDTGSYTLSRAIPENVPFNGGKYAVAFESKSATKSWQYRVLVDNKIVTPPTRIAGQRATLDITIDANYGIDRRTVVIEVAEAGGAAWSKGLESRQESALTMVGNYFWAKGNVVLRDSRFAIADSMTARGLLFRDGSRYGVPSDARNYAGTAYMPEPVQIKATDIPRNEGFNVCAAISPELRLPTWAELDDLRGNEKSRLAKKGTLCMSYINSTFLMPLHGRMDTKDSAIYDDVAIYFGDGYDNEGTAVIYGVGMGENGYSLADFDYTLSDDYMGSVRCVRNIAKPSYISHTPAEAEGNKGFELVVNTSRGEIHSIYYIEVAEFPGVNARSFRKQADAQGTAKFDIPQNTTNATREWAIFVNGQDTGKRVKQRGI